MSSNIKINTTQEFINSFKGNVSVGTVVATLGYTTVGDGGGAQWEKSATTGQTPSRTPIQLGDSLLNDASGNQWAMLLTNDVEFKTFAEISTLSIGNVYQKFTCRERANAQYILQASGYVALAGDVTFANGLIGALQLNGRDNGQWFGVTGDGTTDDYQAIMDAKSRSNHVFLPKQIGPYYRISRGLRMDKKGFTFELLSADTKIYCSGDAAGLNQWPEFSAVIMGTYTNTNLQGVTEYSLSSVTSGSQSITMTTAGQASNFSVGDAVLVKSTSEYTITDGPRPIWGNINVVESILGGVITLRHNINESGAAVIQNLTNNSYNYRLASGLDTGLSNFAAIDVCLIGGTYLTAADEAAFSGGGGMVDCDINIHSTVCRSGAAYGNLKGNCNIKVNHQSSRKSGTELAYCSHNNNVEIINDECRDASGSFSPSTGAVWINESSRNNHVKIKNLNTSNFNHESAVAITSAADNLIEIGSIQGSALGQTNVSIQDIAYAGIRNTTRNNKIVIGASTANAGSAARFLSAGQLDSNTITIKSTATHTNAVLFDGCNKSSFIDSSLTSGAILSRNGASAFSTSDSYIAGGINLTTDADIEISEGVYSNVITDKSILLHTVNTSRLPVGTITLASPYSLTRTLPAGAFNTLDTIEIELSAFVSAGSAAANKNFSLTFGGQAVFNVQATAASQEVIIKGFFSYQSDTVLQANFVSLINDDVFDIKVRQLNVSSLLSNPQDIVLEINPTNAADTVSLRYLKIKTKSMNAGEY